MRKYPLIVRETYTPYGDPYKFYSKGHHDKTAFVAAVAERYDLDLDEAGSCDDVTHSWWSWRPDPAGDLDSYIVERCGPGRGVFPVTCLCSG